MLPFWQLAAALIALILVAVAAFGYLRYPRPLALIPILLLVGVPILGLAYYAVRPGEVPRPGWLLWLAFIPVLIGLAAGVAMLGWALRSKDPMSQRAVRMLGNAIVVMWFGIVLAISDFVALWEPVAAIANIAVNAVWALAWVPRRTRELRVDSSVDVQAPASRIFEFIAEPANWPHYQEDVEAVSVTPAGPLAVGSHVEVRRHVPVPGLRGPRILPASVTTRSTITRLERDRAIASQTDGRPLQQVSIELSPANDGTKVTTSATALMPLRFALFGAMLQLRAMRRDREAAAERSVQKLKALLEQP